MHKSMLMLFLAVAVVGLAGCPELKTLRRQKASLEGRLTSCQQELDAYREETARLQTQRDQYRDQWQQAEQEAAGARELVGRLQQEQNRLEQQRRELESLVRNLSGISIESRREGNFIVLENDILFELGKTDLSEQAKQSLNKVATYLKDKADVKVRIDGHTDGVPVTVSGWKDNYHLSAMRAHAVMQYLVQQDLNADRMYIAGFGPNQPRIEPENPQEPVAANRRVEILVVPEGGRSVSEILQEFRD